MIIPGGMMQTKLARRLDLTLLARTKMAKNTLHRSGLLRLAACALGPPAIYPTGATGEPHSQAPSRSFLHADTQEIFEYVGHLPTSLSPRAPSNSAIDGGR